MQTVDILQRFHLVALCIIPAYFQDAVFLKQRCFDYVVLNLVAVVVMLPNEIDIVGCLFRVFLIFRANRLKLANLIAAAEYLHKVWHKAFHHVLHIAAYKLRAAFLLIAERLLVIQIHRTSAVFGYLAIHIINRVEYLLTYHSPQIVI